MDVLCGQDMLGNRLGEYVRVWGSRWAITWVSKRGPTSGWCLLYQSSWGRGSGVGACPHVGLVEGFNICLGVGHVSETSS